MTITRRDLLKTATAGGLAVTAVGTGAIGTASARPCHKDFSCEDGTYVKYELVEQADGTCTFEEETNTGLFGGADGQLEITETKGGDSCEPIAVQWEEAGYVATKVMAFGGNDCGTVSNPRGSYDATDPESGLETRSDNTAAISNLQFCVVEGIYAQIDFAKGDVVEDLCEDQLGSDKISSITWGSVEGQIDGVQGQFDGSFVLPDDEAVVKVTYDPEDYDENLWLGVYLVPDPVFKDSGHIDFGATRCRQVLVDRDVDEVGDQDGMLTASLPSP